MPTECFVPGNRLYFRPQAELRQDDPFQNSIAFFFNPGKLDCVNPGFKRDKVFPHFRTYSIQIC